MIEISFGSNSSAQLRAFDGFEDLARQTAGYLTRGRIALSGGTTYATLYPHWVLANPDASEASFFPVDERIVPFDDPKSTWGVAYKRFLKPLGKAQDKAHWSISAQEYRAILRDCFGEEEPVFDAVFLGVGTDGHTAGLFPTHPYLDDKESIVLHTKSPTPPIERVTLAPRVLVLARTLITIIAGLQKKKIWERIAQADMALPIVKILSRRQSSLLFVEQSLIGED